MKPKTITIVCESGLFRSKKLARKIYNGYKEKKINVKINTVYIRNENNNPYLSPLKFIAYMLMQPLTKEIADKSDEIITVEPWQSIKLIRKFKQPKEKVSCYEIKDHSPLITLIPLLNKKFAKQLEIQANKYFRRQELSNYLVN